MRLKGINLSGFKSFADKTIIKFDTGMTAIVGPNGCGKSNISDAVRWVLGEQGAKALRGKTMTDVIFNGTALRKSLSYTEVSLIFDNSDKSIDLPYDEVIMTRKLYRSGDSEYCLNNTPCLRRDLVSYLHDSGVGKDGYSIIGQGKVQEIMLAKPADRRLIFEEAAGISKFKQQKHESESKLARTRENLNLIDVSLSEITRQLEPLRKQSETAKTALKIKEELKDLEVNAFIFQHENAETAKNEIKERLKGFNDNLELRQKELDVAVMKYNQCMNEIDELDKTISEIHEEIVQNSVNLEKCSSEARIIEEKLNAQLEQETRLLADLEKYSTQASIEKENLKNRTERKAELEQKLKDLRAKIDKTSAEYLEIIDKLTESERNAETSQNSIIEALDKLGDVKASMSKLTAEEANLEAIIQDVSKRLNFFTEKYNQNMQLEEEARDVYESVKNRLEELTEIVNELTKENNESLFLLKKLENELPDLKSELSAYSQRQKILIEMQADYEGFNGTVKKLLKDAKTNPQVNNEIVGVVATLMKVPAHLETAIEIALGSAMQNVVTYNEDGAKKLINYLKQRQYGRATFLPLTTIKPRYFDENKKSYLNRDGVLGIADKLVSFDSQVSNIFSALLGTTVICENMDVALELAKDTRFSFKIVTLEGDVVSTSGSMTGGSKKSEVTNLLSREREIKDVVEKVKNLQIVVSQKEQQKQNLEKKTSELKVQLQIQTDAKHKYEIQSATESEKLNKLVAYNSEYRIQIDQLQSELELNSNKLQKVKADIKTINALEQTISENKENAGASITKRQEEFAKQREHREEVYERMTNLKIEVAQTEQEIFAVDSEISRISAVISENDISLQEINASLNKTQKQIAVLKANYDNATKDAHYVELKKVLELSKSKLSNVEQHKQSIQSEMNANDEKKTVLTAEISKINEKIYKEEVNLAKVDTDIENLQEHIYEEYELTYETSLEYRIEDFDINQGMIEINRLKKDYNKLGYINLNAIEDFKNLNERYEALNVEADDLRRAESDLTQIIKELSTEMSTRFEETFNVVNQNFSKIFKELFNGGRAELKMLPSEDGDSLKDGVDIIAEPPGKKLQSITLLSGGEQALTAIAILFAILKYRSMPFCLLDEIEAALDDANVGRFATYLKRFSEDTQFIVITHRKPTMEQADALYGVTMQEKGVSSIVSVKLTDIQEG